MQIRYCVAAYVFIPDRSEDWKCGDPVRGTRSLMIQSVMRGRFDSRSRAYCQKITCRRAMKPLTLVDGAPVRSHVWV